MKEAINTASLQEFAGDCARSGLMPEGIDYVHLRVQEFAIVFTYNPVLSNTRSAMRPLIAEYAHLIAQFKNRPKGKTLQGFSFGQSDFYKSGGSSLMDAVAFLRAVIRYQNNRERYESYLGRKYSFRYTYPKDLHSELEFLAEREQDPVLKTFIENLIKKGKGRSLNSGN